MTTPTTPTLPTIHLDGTSAVALYEQAVAACRALRAALDAVSEAAPNARDYYVIDSRAFRKATQEHDAIHDALRVAIAHFEAHAERAADVAIAAEAADAADVARFGRRP